MPKKKRAECPGFVDWITEVGAKELADQLGLKIRTVYFWRSGAICPRPAQMREIRKLSKGRVTYEMIIDGPVASRKS